MDPIKLRRLILLAALVALLAAGLAALVPVVMTQLAAALAPGSGTATSSQADAATPPASATSPEATPTTATPPAVPFIRPSSEWDRFLIMVWQFNTSASKEIDLYKQAGFHGFHIDRGGDSQAVVDWARQSGFPYYVDHAADKGYLHLTEAMGLDSILHKKTVVARPNSLVDPKTIDTMKGFLRRNIATTKAGPVVAYAFDDEVSLGTFTSPIEADGSDLSVAAYRRWLRQTYGTLERLNAKWGTAYKDFAEARPGSFEDVRGANSSPPLARWNLARWMDWRSYMDTQFADCLADLTRFANSLDPRTPAGFVGGQQPAPYGGYDYAKLTRAVQWTEAYDIGGTCEILRSLWKWPERRPYVQPWTM